MIIKKHIANNTKEGLSYISQNFKDDGLIISNSRVAGKNVIYFAVNEKPGISTANASIVDNDSAKSYAQDSSFSFTSGEANDLFNSVADKNLNPIDPIRSTPKEISECTSQFEAKPSRNPQAVESLVTDEEIINIDQNSLKSPEEINSIIHLQNHTNFESKYYESHQSNNLLDLIINQSSLIQQSYESILAVQVASQESIKHLADAIIELKKQYGVSNSEIRKYYGELQ
jgi:flagellar biosynthesis GTPase FlhF